MSDSAHELRNIFSSLCINGDVVPLFFKLLIAPEEGMPFCSPLSTYMKQVMLIINFLGLFYCHNGWLVHHCCCS